MNHNNHDDRDDYGPHWHVVAFVNGLLNDYESEPYDTLDGARMALMEYVDDGGMIPRRPCQRIDRDTYLKAHYVITIESCFDDCDDGESW